MILDNKKHISAFKLTLCICLQYVFFSGLQAQSEDMDLPRHKKLYDYEQIFSSSHWNFFVRPSMMLTAPYHYTQPGLDFRFQAVHPDLMCGWMYEFNFKKWWGIQTGFAIDHSWVRTGYLNAKAYNGIRDDGTNYSYSNNFLVLTLPIYAVYRLPLYDMHHSWLLDFKLGVDIRYIDSYKLWYDSYEGLPGTNSYQFVDFTLYNPRIVDAIFHLSAGTQYILPNKNLLEFSLIGGYAPFYRQSAYYSFSVGTPQEVDGSFSRTYGYLGFELNYVFTRVRHMKMARPGYTVEPLKMPRHKRKEQSKE